MPPRQCSAAPATAAARSRGRLPLRALPGRYCVDCPWLFIVWNLQRHYYPFSQKVLITSCYVGRVAQTGTSGLMRPAVERAGVGAAKWFHSAVVTKVVASPDHSDLDVLMDMCGVGVGGDFKTECRPEGVL